MLFNSIEYLLFFLSALALCWLLVGVPRLRIWVLLLASYYFYMSWRVEYALLIMASTVVVYASALAIERAESDARKRLFVGVSVVFNFGLLFAFKYFNFLSRELQALFDDAGIDSSVRMVVRKRGGLCSSVNSSFMVSFSSSTISSRPAISLLCSLSRATFVRMSHCSN